MSWREGTAVGHAEFKPFGGGLMPSAPLIPDGMDDPLVRAAIAGDRDLRQFLAWSILPVATVEPGRCQAKITIGDARYSIPGSRNSRLAREVVVPLRQAVDRPDHLSRRDVSLPIRRRWSPRRGRAGVPVYILDDEREHRKMGAARAGAHHTSSYSGQGAGKNSGGGIFRKAVRRVLADWP